MLAEDGNKFVTKFQGNPQHNRVLANEYLACRLARMIGLSVPEPVIIDVDEQTIREQQITFTLAGRAVRHILARSSALAMVTADLVFDFLPRTMLGRVRNIPEIRAECSLLTSGPVMPMDGKPYFTRVARQRKYRHCLLDRLRILLQRWRMDFPRFSAPLRGHVCAERTSMPTHRIHGTTLLPGSNVSSRLLCRASCSSIADEIPCEWYGERSELECLSAAPCWSGAALLRQLIEDFRLCSRSPFPSWEALSSGTALAAEQSGQQALAAP